MVDRKQQRASTKQEHWGVCIEERGTVCLALRLAFRTWHLAFYLAWTRRCICTMIGMNWYTNGIGSGLLCIDSPRSLRYEKNISLSSPRYMVLLSSSSAFHVKLVHLTIPGLIVVTTRMREWR